MTTAESIRLYDATWFGRSLRPRRTRQREAAADGPHRPPSKYRPVASTDPDATPWLQAGHGQRGPLVRDTYLRLRAEEKPATPADVAREIGGPVQTIRTHLKRLVKHGQIPPRGRR